MSYINKSASKIGAIEYRHGNGRLHIWIGANRNNGETIVWQKLEGRRAVRVTGRNIQRFAEDLNACMNEGEAVWIEKNDAALDALVTHGREDRGRQCA